MKYITYEEILIIHSEIIDNTGGLHGIRDLNLLASVINKPRSIVNKKTVYNTIYEKAACYLESFAQYHVFSDGNKRTALAACALFLYKNKKELAVSEKEMVKFVLKIAKKQTTFDKIIDWVKKHTK